MHEGLGGGHKQPGDLVDISLYAPPLGMIAGRNLFERGRGGERLPASASKDGHGVNGLKVSKTMKRFGFAGIIYLVIIAS